MLVPFERLSLRQIFLEGALLVSASEGQRAFAQRGKDGEGDGDERELCWAKFAGSFWDVNPGLLLFWDFLFFFFYFLLVRIIYVMFLFFHNVGLNFGV